jgi:F0F1-type ATP synthase epsilon subunit
MDNLTLFVRDRERVLFTGAVRAVSSVNKKGKFDILPKHANFISLVGQTLIVQLPEGGRREIQVDNGILRVVRNKIEVYLGIKA